MTATGQHTEGSDLREATHLGYRETLFIDGEVRASRSGRRIGVESPATEQEFGQADHPTIADVDEAVAAARRTFDDGTWTSTSQEDRARIILGACDRVEKDLDEISIIQSREMGSPAKYVRLSGEAAIGVVRRLVDLAASAPSCEERHGMWHSVVRHEPVGVSAQIAPWNGPFAMSIMKSAGALLAGCTVVDKPAIETPYDAMYWARALHDAGLPAGAYNLVPGDVEAGSHLVNHSDTDMVSFTGGTRAGRAIGAACGQQLKPALLELGGKSPAIVLDDADTDLVARYVCASLLPNAGQVCSGFSRVLVPAHLREEVSAKIVAIAEGMVVGDPLDAATTMGPLGSAQQFTNVNRYIESGLEQGATLLTGGTGRPSGLDRGYFVRPTIFGNVDNSMTIAREEIFGPVISIIEYTDVDDAVRIGNDTEFGLHAGVFSEDREAAMSVAARLRTGSVTLNAFTINFESPRDGVKASGLGVRFGTEGFEENKYLKTINVEPTANAYAPDKLL